MRPDAAEGHANPSPPPHTPFTLPQPCFILGTVKCASCGSENPEGNSYCGSCGQKLFQAFDKVAVEGDDGAFYCYRHKRESTRLSCGRCGKPVCTRCAVLGPAGIRCPECAKQHIAFRPMGAVSDLTRGLRNVGRGGSYTIYIWIVVTLLVLSYVGSCSVMRQSHQYQPTRKSSESRDSDQ